MNDTERASGPISLSRDQLYQLVWDSPMIRLGERFGLSDNGLRKICRRLDIPCPPAGWWAKKAAGKPVKAIPLPALKQGVRTSATISPTATATDDLRNAIRQEAARLGPIAIPDRLVRPHPVIGTWIDDRRRRQQDTRRDRRPGPIRTNGSPISRTPSAGATASCTPCSARSRSGK